MVGVTRSSGDSGLLRDGIRLVIGGEAGGIGVARSSGDSGLGGHGI